MTHFCLHHFGVIFFVHDYKPSVPRIEEVATHKLFFPVVQK